MNDAGDGDSLPTEKAVRIKAILKEYPTLDPKTVEVMVKYNLIEGQGNDYDGELLIADIKSIALKVREKYPHLSMPEEKYYDVGKALLVIKKGLDVAESNRLAVNEEFDFSSLESRLLSFLLVYLEKFINSDDESFPVVKTIRSIRVDTIPFGTIEFNSIGSIVSVLSHVWAGCRDSVYVEEARKFSLSDILKEIEATQLKVKKLREARSKRQVSKEISFLRPILKDQSTELYSILRSKCQSNNKTDHLIYELLNLIGYYPKIHNQHTDVRTKYTFITNLRKSRKD